MIQTPLHLLGEALQAIENYRRSLSNTGDSIRDLIEEENRRQVKEDSQNRELSFTINWPVTAKLSEDPKEPLASCDTQAAPEPNPVEPKEGPRKTKEPKFKKAKKSKAKKEPINWNGVNQR